MLMPATWEAYDQVAGAIARQAPEAEIQALGAAYWQSVTPLEKIRDFAPRIELMYTRDIPAAQIKTY